MTHQTQAASTLRMKAGPSVDNDVVCRIISKGREIGVKELAGESDSASSAVDDAFRGVLAATRDDPVYEELRTYIDGLDVDDQCDLVALMWVGRGDYGPAEWNEAIGLARQKHTARTSSYLLETLLLPDYLTEGLSQFGRSCEAFDTLHL